MSVRFKQRAGVVPRTSPATSPPSRPALTLDLCHAAIRQSHVRHSGCNAGLICFMKRNQCVKTERPLEVTSYNWYLIDDGWNLNIVLRNLSVTKIQLKLVNSLKQKKDC